MGGVFNPYCRLFCSIWYIPLVENGQKVVLRGGLPWTISNLLGKKVGIHKEQKLQRTAFFQVGIVATVAFTLLGFAIIQGENKASLTKMKGRLYLILYGAVLITLAVMAFS